MIAHPPPRAPPIAPPVEGDAEPGLEADDAGAPKGIGADDPPRPADDAGLQSWLRICGGVSLEGGFGSLPPPHAAKTRKSQGVARTRSFLIDRAILYICVPRDAARD